MLASVSYNSKHMFCLKRSDGYLFKSNSYGSLMKRMACYIEKMSCYTHTINFSCNHHETLGSTDFATCLKKS